jgi:hypothetical protein
MTDFKDLGVIYGNLGKAPHQRGTTIRRNFFENVANTLPKQNAIYPDNGTMGWAIEENIFFRVGNVGKKAFGAIMTNGGSYLSVRNNVFVDCARAFHQSFFLATWHKNGLPAYQKKWDSIMTEHNFSELPHGKRYPGLLNLLEEDRVQPNSCVYENNLVWNPTFPLKYREDLSVSGGPRKLVSTRNNQVVEKNPGYPKWKDGDFSLDKREGYRLRGMPSIPFEKIGRRSQSGPLERVSPLPHDL